MQRIKHIFALAFVAVLCFQGANAQHFLTDETYRASVHEDFLKRKELAAGRATELFGVFDKPGLTTEQREALEFLYAYMPLCDLGEYDGEFFLEQVDAAFRARDFFHWGKTIPEDIFRHFVLIHRVNNEYLDDSRNVFFEELKDRIKDMSMEQAALEVNHWCHEKVTYRATDPRTSAPLALVKTSWGRCGEESAFGAAALRAVGIPARQVYTPRWVHTDSNHAWVEVWIDGQWKYLGACEPEPELNVAWFSAPAKRMMMAHTSVMGLYEGQEEKTTITPLYTTINLMENYAVTRVAKVKVTDADGAPVTDAKVGYKVYNSAELYHIGVAKSDAAGMASIVTGQGELVVWASKDDRYGYAKSTPQDEVLTVVLDREPGRAYTEDFVINVPKELPVKGLSREQIAQNAVRLAHEDSIRNAYMSTFPTEQYAHALADRNGLDRAMTWKYLGLAQGNWRDIEAFITEHKANPRLFPFLGSVLEKDLRDTPKDYLDHHFLSFDRPGAGIPEDIFVNKVLSPRIYIELIKPWRTYLQGVIKEKGLDTPERIIEYVNSSVEVSTWQNYYACYLTPQGTDELKVADPSSRNIYFVALCRTAGIPAHIDKATSKPQYYRDGVWIDAVFNDTTIPANNPKGELTLLNGPSNIIKPGYGKHFTIAYYNNGDFLTLDLKTDPALADFPAKLTLDEGYYRLLTGSRLNDGSVSITTEYFELGPDKPHTTTIKFPETGDKLFVKGIIDMNSIVALEEGGKATLKELSKGKGLVLCFADPDKEPTKHILQDLPSQCAELEEWGGGILFMVPDDKLSTAFDASQFRGLPSQVTWGVDNGRELLAQAIDALQLEFTDNFPVVIYLNSNGGILFSTAGYRIGIGEDIVKTIKMENKGR